MQDVVWVERWVYMRAARLMVAQAAGVANTRRRQEIIIHRARAPAKSIKRPTRYGKPQTLGGGGSDALTS